MKKYLAAFSLFLAAVLVQGCSNYSTTSSEKLKVVATTTQVGDFVRAVGGKYVSVTQILGANTDPHEYEPRPSDAEGLINASVVFSSGGSVDAWLTGLIENSEADSKKVTLINQVRTIRSSDSGEVDPHWWQDPRNVKLAIKKITAELSRRDPKHRRQFTNNAKRYLHQLQRLDRAAAICLAKIPVEHRKLVTNHDALAYLADRYKIKLVGTVIPSLSTQAQPSARATKRLIELIKKEQVRAIFPESSVSQKLEKAVAAEAGVRVARPLWADTLGPKGSSGSTYLGSLRSNVLSLVNGLSNGSQRCSLPRR